MLALVAKGANATPPSGAVSPVSVADANGITYVFDVVQTPSTSGFVVLAKPGALGPVAFDAMAKNARVIDIFGGSGPQSGLGTRTYPTGRTYAAGWLQKSAAFTWSLVNPNIPTGPRNLSTTTMGIAVGSTTVTTSSTTTTSTEDAGPTTGTFGGGPWSAIVLDVTNY